MLDFMISRCFPLSKASSLGALNKIQFHRLISSISVPRSSRKHSLTISYLTKNCGFPLEKAVSASRYVKRLNPERADSVLAFFSNNGFTKTQVSTLVRRFPNVLKCNPEKIYLPKVEFFSSLGFSKADLAEIFTASPIVLARSLEYHIAPTFESLRNLLQQPNDRMIHVIKRRPGILNCDFERCISPNIQALREAGVPASNIMYLFTNHPRNLMYANAHFIRLVEELRGMGFNPVRRNYILAIHALRSLTKELWEKKMELFNKWGLSKEEMLVAIRRWPRIMLSSEDKISRTMDFLVNEMKWDASVIARQPSVMSLSLGKRIVPRCLFHQYLLENGLTEHRKGSSAEWLKSSESIFANRIRKRYQEDATELLNVYQEKLDLAK